MLTINLKSSDLKQLKAGNVESVYAGKASANEDLLVTLKDGKIALVINRHPVFPKGYLQTKTLLVPDLEGRYIPSEAFKKAVNEMVENGLIEHKGFFYRNLPGHTLTEFVTGKATDEEKEQALSEAYKNGFLSKVEFTLKFTGEGKPIKRYSSSCYEVTGQKDILYKFENETFDLKPVTIPARVNVIADEPLEVIDL